MESSIRGLANWLIHFAEHQHELEIQKPYESRPGLTYPVARANWLPEDIEIKYLRHFGAPSWFGVQIGWSRTLAVTLFWFSYNPSRWENAGLEVDVHGTLVWKGSPIGRGTWLRGDPDLWRQALGALLEKVSRAAQTEGLSVRDFEKEREMKEAELLTSLEKSVERLLQ